MESLQAQRARVGMMNPLVKHPLFAVQYVQILAGCEDFEESAGARPSWPQQPRTHLPPQPKSRRVENRGRCGQDGRAPMGLRLRRAVIYTLFRGSTALLQV
ncbi:MAG: hypothetical protein HY735_02715 [Verrucomicrobia bacterium]|nr:hypothetical protein [Verrucomicrobiota bacterium]